MSGPTAFSGLKLSESTPPGGLDQRLFGPLKPSEPESGAAPDKQATKEPPEVVPQRDAANSAPKPPANGPSDTPPRTQPIVRVLGKRVREPGAAGAARWAELAFDINVKPYRKDSFLFTDDEFEAMEDLKLELKRTYDLPATKNDIARIALQALFEEYAKRSSESTVVKRLTRKKT